VHQRNVSRESQQHSSNKKLVREEGGATLSLAEIMRGRVKTVKHGQAIGGKTKQEKGRQAQKIEGGSSTLDNQEDKPKRRGDEEEVRSKGAF